MVVAYHNDSNEWNSWKMGLSVFADFILMPVGETERPGVGFLAMSGSSTIHMMLAKILRHSLQYCPGG